MKCLILIVALVLTGCQKPNQLYSLIEEDPLKMEFCTIQNDRSHRYSNLMEVESNYELLEDMPESYYEHFGNRKKYGYDTIILLQDLLKNCEIKETEEKPRESDLFYYLKTESNDFYYFYTTYYIKYVSEEKRVFYIIEDSSYQETVDQLFSELEELSWY